MSGIEVRQYPARWFVRLVLERDAADPSRDSHGDTQSKYSTNRVGFAAAMCLSWNARGWAWEEAQQVWLRAE